MKVRARLPALVLGPPWRPWPPPACRGNDDCLACHGDKDLKSAAGKSAVRRRREVRRLDPRPGRDRLRRLPRRPEEGQGLPPRREAQTGGLRRLPRQGIGPDQEERPRPAPPRPRIRSPSTAPTATARTTSAAKDDAESSVFAINIPDTCDRCHAERVKIKNGNDFVRQYTPERPLPGPGESGPEPLGQLRHLPRRARRQGHVAIPQSRVARKSIIRTCGRCHVGIEKNYLEGVHGKDLRQGRQGRPGLHGLPQRAPILAPDDSQLATSTPPRSPAVCTPLPRRRAPGPPVRPPDLAAEVLLGLLSTGRPRSSARRGWPTAPAATASTTSGPRPIPSRPSTRPTWPRPAASATPGRGRNFAKGKIHVVSAKTENKSGHVIKIVYIIIIAALISVFLLFIAADLFHRMRTRWTKP